jgi:hypothetical protein
VKYIFAVGIALIIPPPSAMGHVTVVVGVQPGTVSGRVGPSGVYFVHLAAGDRVSTGRVTLVR